MKTTTLAVLLLWAPSACAGVVIGANFTGSNFSESGGFVPPDTMGAVGPNNYVELLNNIYAVYNKTGTLASRTSMDNFWINAGVTPVGISFDPRVIYDPANGHWFASSLDFGTADGGGDNNLLLAASVDSDPTHGWHAVKIPAASGGTFADFDMLGLNQTQVVVGLNMFPTSAPESTQFVTIPTADLLAVDTSHVGFISSTIAATGQSPHPAYGFSNTGALPFLSDFNTPGGFLRGGTVNGTSLVLSSPAAATAHGEIPPPIEPGGNVLTTNIDDRFSGAVYQQGNFLYSAQNVDAGGRGAVRWVIYDLTLGTVAHEGLIGDPNHDYTYGSIAVDPAGEAVIGFTRSSDTEFASAYAVFGTTDISGSLLFGAPILLKAGSGISFDGRWGDYSSTTLDPSNPGHFWTIQEFADVAGDWNTQITELFAATSAPEPGTLTLAGAVLAVLGFWRRRVRID